MMKQSIKKFVSLALVLTFLLAFPATLQASSDRFAAWRCHNDMVDFTFDSAIISTTIDRWERYVHTINVGTTLFVETPDPEWVSVSFWQIHPADSEGYNEASFQPIVRLSDNVGTFIFNTIGSFNVCGEKMGGFAVIVVGNNVTAQPPVQQPPPADNQIPQFVRPPSTTDNGAWMEFTTVPNNRFGYRIFRATTETGDGISITDFPIMVNPSHSLERIITFDPNLRPDRDYWFYIREVLEEARFDASTATLIPEVLGPSSARVHVRTPADMPEWTLERGFIMMFIGNPFMNVNNEWEGIDPPQNNTAPVITAGRTMIPIRAIVEAMGGTVGWNDADRRIDLRSHDNHVQMWLEQRGVQVNNSANEMDVVPQIVNGRTLIPVRFVAEFLGAQIEWIGSEQMVVIVYELQ